MRMRTAVKLLWLVVLTLTMVLMLPVWIVCIVLGLDGGCDD